MMQEELLEETGQKVADDDDVELDRERIRIIRELFNEYDTDGSGYMDRREMETFCRVILGDPMSMAELDDLYDKADENNDNMIHWDEFIDYWRNN